VERVRVWRKGHPGYWRKKASALQTVMLSQPALLVGIISVLTGTELQAVIAEQVQRLHLRGEQILHPQEATKGNEDERQRGAASGSVA
jgi:hypothetical protein